MALFEEMVEGGSVGSGLVIGIGALILGPALFPILGRVARPLISGVVESGRVLVNEVSQGVNQMSEVAGTAGNRLSAATAGTGTGNVTRSGDDRIAAGMSEAGHGSSHENQPEQRAEEYNRT